MEPSDLLAEMILKIDGSKSNRAGLRAAMERVTEFRDQLQAQLTGIALDPRGRESANAFLDQAWSDVSDRENLLGTDIFTDPKYRSEIIIGSGVHAAVYAANRVLSGYPRPLVLERSTRVGGTFAVTDRPTFFLNSRNQPGLAGIAGDQTASLNYLPGAPIQAVNVGMSEYPTNEDMAFVVRATLAQFADVVTSAEVTRVETDDMNLVLRSGERIRARRIIDARGVGDTVSEYVDGKRILSFPQFMTRMAGNWPLRGLERVAVVGGGDSGKCIVESLLGLSPQPFMSAMALDHVDNVDWFSTELPREYDRWQDIIRGRYQPIGRYLKKDRLGFQRLTVVPRRTQPVALPDYVSMNGKAYNLVIMATGNQVREIPGLEDYNYGRYTGRSGEAIARAAQGSALIYRVGPHADLPFSDRERQDGAADIQENSVSIFRYAPRTAELAVTLG